MSRTLPALTGQPAGPSLDWVTLGYRSSDPYSVAARLEVGGAGACRTWFFARDLLAAGLMRSVGEGDVRISPWSAAGERPDEVRLALRSAGGDVLVQVDAGDLREFVAATELVCRSGNESAHLDLDAELTVWIS